MPNTSSFRTRFDQFTKGAKELYVEFVNTANPHRLNEDVDAEEQPPLHSDTRFECLDYHNPFPSIYLDHLRNSREAYEGAGRLRGNSVSNRAAAAKGYTAASAPAGAGPAPSANGSSDSSFTDNDESALQSTVRQSMRRMVKGVKTLNTTRRGNVILRWILHIVIAISVALVAFAMIYAADNMYEWRYHVLKGIIKEDDASDAGFGGYMLGWLFWVSTSAAIVGVAAGAVHFVPAASGSGLPDVISFLNGVMRPRVVNLKTFIGKAISCVCCVGGGMPAGMEAPLIHIGAIVGSGVTQGRSRTLNCKTPLFQSLRTNKDRRDFITAGAACGVSAAFGAPIGGLLFIMEEVASFWDHNNSGQVFLSTMTCFTMIAFLNGLSHDLLHNAYVLFEVDVKIPLNITAIIPAIFLGGICGLLASAFTKVNLMIIKWRRRVIRPYALRKVLEPVLIAIVYVSIAYWMSLVWPCSDIVSASSDDSSSSIIHWETENITELSSVGCNHNSQYSPMGSLALKTSKETIRHLFTRRTVNEFPAGTLVCFLILYICAACYTSGSAVSTGLVVPMLVIGATVGRLFGLIVVKGFAATVDGHSDVYKYDQSWMDPGVYALIGAGAFFSGCTRMMISVCVIMVELAGDLHYLLPGMVAIVISKITADYFAKPLYHAQLHLDHVPFLPSHWDESMMEAYTAADVMSNNVVTLREQEYTQVVLAALRTTQHHAFPIVRPMEDGSEKFVGMVTREDIQVYLALPELQVQDGVAPPAGGLENTLLNPGRQQGQREEPHNVISPEEHRPSDLEPENLPSCVKEASRLTWTQWMAHQSSLFLKMGDRKWHEAWDSTLAAMSGATAPAEGSSAIGISSLPPVVDLCIITNRSPYVVPPFFNLSLTYSMFRSVGLRHLVVLDGQTVVGVITRKDLLHFSEKGMREGSTAEFHADSSASATTHAMRRTNRSRTNSLSESSSLNRHRYPKSGSTSEMHTANRFVDSSPTVQGTANSPSRAARSAADAAAPPVPRAALAPSASSSAAMGGATVVGSINEVTPTSPATVVEPNHDLDDFFGSK